jgi:hypothetical protein
LRFDPDPAARDASRLDNAVEDAAGDRYGDGETNAEAAARLGKNGGVDTDQMTIAVDKCSAGVASAIGRVRSRFLT